MGSSSSKEIEKLKQEIKEKDDRIKELMNKYADNMHTDLSANETTFENVKIPFRPMTVADNYTNLCTDAWLEAKMEIDESKDTQNMPEINKIKLLCSIVEVAGDESRRYHEDLWKNLVVLLNEPIEGVSRLETLSRIEKSTPQKMQNMIGDHFRNTAERISLKPLIEQIEQKTERSTDDEAAKKALKLKQVQAFITAAAGIGWKMALQRPPMTFKTPDVGKPWKGSQDKYKLEAQFGSNCTHPNAIIHAYVHPILYHDNAIMGRAKVIVGPPGMVFENE